MNQSVNGTLILILGILGFVLCPVFGLVSWSVGTTALRTLDEDGVYEGTDRSLANAGRVCGIVSSLLWLAALLIRLAVGRH